MPTSLAVAAATVIALWPFGHRAPLTTEAYELGTWRLDVSRDSFTQEISCRLRNDYGHFPNLTATSAALAVKLRGGADGSHAWFSVDGAPARPWHDMEATLIAQGALAEADELDNATGGQLPLPYSAIGKARFISVQAATGRSPTTYEIGRLWAMISAANRLGCGYHVAF